MFGEKEWKNLQSIYTQVLSDVLEKKNLQKHSADVNNAIDELKHIINDERLRTGKPTPTLDDILNDIGFLYSQINAVN